MMKRLFLILAAALAVGGTALANAPTPVELGVQYDIDGFAPYVYITRDFYVGNILAMDIYVSPSAEIVFKNPPEGFAQLQVLFDTRPFTLDLYGGVRHYQGNTTTYLRLGVLFEL